MDGLARDEIGFDLIHIDAHAFKSAAWGARTGVDVITVLHRHDHGSSLWVNEQLID